MNLIKKFLLFFLFSAVLPLLIFGSYLLRESNLKLNERFNNLLKTAEALVDKSYQSDLNSLELSNNQVASVSLAEDFEQYLNTGNHGRLGIILNKFQKNRKLDLVALTDSSGKVIASTDTFEIASKDSLSQLIKTSLKGKNVSSIEQLGFEGGRKNHLTYISVSPIFSEKEPKGVIGALLIGQDVKENNTFSKLTKNFPYLKIKIIENIQVDQETAAKELRHKPFESITNQKIYRSSLLPLTNFSNETVGYIEVNVSQDLEKQLRIKNSALILISLLFAILGVITSGFWFNRNFVEPMNLIAAACRKLSNGNLKVQIHSSRAKSEMKEAIADFNLMVSQLQEKEQMRNNFISTLTHDLKTPLLAQKRVVEIMQDFGQNFDADIARLIKGLESNNQHLLNMVNLLLDTYKYDSEGLVLRKENTNLQSIILESLENVDSLIKTKFIKIENNISNETQLKQVDPAQLKRVFINLLGNAIENIEEKSTITISSLQSAQEIEIIIADNGPGIPEEALEHIFDKYFSQTRSNQKIGTGLGLYICRMIIEAHGGQIAVKSILGSGTSFHITLPN